MQIHELMPKVSDEIGVIRKTHQNTQQNFAYRGVEDVLSAAHGVLIKHGISVRPRVTEVIRTSLTYGKNNTTAQSTIVRMKVAFIAPDGSEVECETAGEGFDSADKGLGKAMSTAYKYAFFLTFCIPTEELKDVEAAPRRQRREPVSQDDFRMALFTKAKGNPDLTEKIKAKVGEHAGDYQAVYQEMFPTKG